MKTPLLFAAILSLSGCASLQDAGHASYEVKANTQGGYDLSVNDGKEFQTGRSIAFEAKGGTLMVQEGPSTAFTGQALAVKAFSILPTVGIPNILTPAGK